MEKSWEIDRMAKPSRRQMKDFVRDYIQKRIEDVNNNPALKTAGGRITLSDVFYDLRKPMEEA